MKNETRNLIQVGDYVTIRPGRTGEGRGGHVYEVNDEKGYIVLLMADEQSSVVQTRDAVYAQIIGVCAWCRNGTDREHNPVRKLSDAEYALFESHGICRSCKAEALDETKERVGQYPKAGVDRLAEDVMAKPANLKTQIRERAIEIMSERKVVCNCGGPQYGTQHSPDCEYVLGADAAWDEAAEEIMGEE